VVAVMPAVVAEMAAEEVEEGKIHLKLSCGYRRFIQENISFLIFSRTPQFAEF
jgi:hypothetical protein